MILFANSQNTFTNKALSGIIRPLHKEDFTMAKRTVKDLDVAGKRVIVRCDFNVPRKDGKDVYKRQKQGISKKSFYR